jgi:hypothetical protein
MAARTLPFMGTVTEKNAPSRQTAPITAAL